MRSSSVVVPGGFAGAFVLFVYIACRFCLYPVSGLWTAFKVFMSVVCAPYTDAAAAKREPDQHVITQTDLKPKHDTKQELDTHISSQNRSSSGGVRGAECRVTSRSWNECKSLTIKCIGKC